MNRALLVFCGAGLGGVARYSINEASARFFVSGFPFPTFGINVVGSFFMGIVTACFIAQDASPNLIVSQDLRLFLATGVLGGFTTFSAFSLEMILLIERGDFLLSLCYAGGSVIVSLLAVFCGFTLVRMFV